ncbi:MAG: hypothetical protein WBW34_00275, partial [Nitrososphaeraceae archaeon]
SHSIRPPLRCGDCMDNSPSEHHRGLYATFSCKLEIKLKRDEQNLSHYLSHIYEGLNEQLMIFELL